MGASPAYARNPAACTLHNLPGFGGGWGRVQILRIMKDSRVGTYALVGMALVLQLKTGALAALAAAQVGRGWRA